MGEEMEQVQTVADVPFVKIGTNLGVYRVDGR